MGPVHEQLFLAAIDLPGGVVSEAIGCGLEHGERLDIGQRLGGVGAARGERYGDVVSGPLGSLLDSGSATKHDQIGHGDPLAVGSPGIKRLLNPRERGQHAGEFGGLVHLPILLRCQPNPTAVGTAPLVAAAKGRCRRPGRGNEVGDRQARSKQRLLEGHHVSFVDQRMIHRRHGILPQLRLRHLGPQEP